MFDIGPERDPLTQQRRSKRAIKEGMTKRSAGILLFRFNNAALEVLLVHPGGPYWANKDAGAWSIPKGEHSDGEDALTAAKREFAEETGVNAEGEFLPLGEVRQAGGKIVQVWALKGDLDPLLIRSNTFTLEWPPMSGSAREFPEVDSAGWFLIPVAKQKLLFGQREFLARLCERLGADKSSS